jgi:hypothetical protein
MLSPIERLKVGYKALMVKMVLDNHINQQAKQIYEHLCDLQILLGLAYILPLLESMHALIKFAHMWMCLCATLWLLSRSVKMIRITCIWNKVQTSLQIPIGHSSPCLNVDMKTST